MRRLLEMYKYQFRDDDLIFDAGWENLSLELGHKDADYVVERRDQ
jgi:hypothetical protein